MNVAEIFAKAGIGTILGMGVVFAVLIFVAYIISLFKYLPGLIDQFHKIINVKAVPPVIEADVVAQTAKDPNSELMVAIIVAAVQAAINNSKPVGDDYFVRSIRRV